MTVPRALNVRAPGLVRAAVLVAISVGGLSSWVSAAQAGTSARASPLLLPLQLRGVEVEVGKEHVLVRSLLEISPGGLSQTNRMDADPVRSSFYQLGTADAPTRCRAAPAAPSAPPADDARWSTVACPADPAGSPASVTPTSRASRATLSRLGRLHRRVELGGFAAGGWLEITSEQSRAPASENAAEERNSSQRVWLPLPDIAHTTSEPADTSSGAFELTVEVAADRRLNAPLPSQLRRQDAASDAVRTVYAARLPTALRAASFELVDAGRPWWQLDLPRLAEVLVVVLGLASILTLWVALLRSPR